MNAEQRYDVGLGHWRAYGESNSTDELDKAVVAFRGAAQANTSESLRYLGKLNEALDARYASGRSSPKQRSQDLNELIAVTRSVLDMAKTRRDLEVALVRNALGGYLVERYWQRGSLLDIEDAIVQFNEVARQVSVRDPRRYGFSINWAAACLARFDRIKDRTPEINRVKFEGNVVLTGPRDLVEPIFVLERLLKPDPSWGKADDRALAGIKRELGNLHLQLVMYLTRVAAERTRAERTAGLRRALELLKQAFTETAESEPSPTAMVATANALFEALVAADSLELLPSSEYEDRPTSDRLVDTLNRGRNNPAVTADKRAHAQVAYARFVAHRHTRWHNPDDERVAREAFKELAADPTPGSRVAALNAAEVWSRWALSREAWDEAVEAYRLGTDQSKAFLSEQLTWNDKYRWVRYATGLAASAAYALAKLKSFAEAAATLESGRAILLSEKLNPTAARRSAVAPAGAVAVYLVPSGKDEILALETAQDGGWAGRWLVADRLVDHVRRFAGALQAFRQAPKEELPAFLDELASVMDWLRPSLVELCRAFDPASTVLLVPTGLLGLLPLPAAAIDVGHGRFLKTKAGISVAPSLGLMHGLTPDVQPEEVLVIADPSLKATRWEEEAVLRSFPKGRPASPPELADPDKLLQAVPPNGVVHFACHASVDLRSPLASQITLPPAQPLRVEDILRRSLPPLRLAVLSACESGLPDPYEMDEAVGLSSAFLAVGVRGVVATLWPVYDVSTALLMMRFYWEWRAQGIPPPAALARAQAWLCRSPHLEKIGFVRQVRGSLLEKESAEAVISEIERHSRRRNGESCFAHPYYWAGFFYSGL